MARKKERGPERLVEPMSLLGLSLGDMLLGLMDTDKGSSGSTGAASARAQGPEGQMLQLRMPDGRVERDPLLGGFWRRDRAGGLTLPRVVTRHGGSVTACKLYRVGEGKALFAGLLKGVGMRAFVGAVPGEMFRYRNAPLRRMTAAEVAAAVDPGLVYDYELLDGEP